MKTLVMALAFLTFGASAQAETGLTCGDLIRYKKNLIQDMLVLQKKIKSAQTLDEVELLVTKWEERAARYAQAEKDLKDICQEITD